MTKVFIAVENANLVKPPPSPMRWFNQDPPALAVTRHNSVTGLIDGASTFHAMVETIRTTQGRSHFICILGWTIYMNFDLSGPGTKLRELLHACALRDVDVRAMIWANFVADSPPNRARGFLPFLPDIPISPGFPPVPLGTAKLFLEAIAKCEGCMPEVTFINQLMGAQGMQTGFSKFTRRGMAIHDADTAQFGAHHQKVLIVLGSEGLVGYCGGVDINPDRVLRQGGSWGSSNEKFPDTGVVQQVGSPMHDVHLRISGPAVLDLLTTFTNRWKGHPSKPEQHADVGGDGMPAVSMFEAWAREPNLSKFPRNGTQLVQIAHTSSPGHPLPSGQKTVRQMMIHAIATTQRFIYIEDQYLWNLEAAFHLASVMASDKRHVFILILIPRNSHTSPPYYSARQRKAFLNILQAHVHEKHQLQVFVRSGVSHTYIHSKTWIFDDEFAVVGSANCNKRGWEHDSEVVAGVADERGGSDSFASSLRRRLWRHHLPDVDPQDLLDPVDAMRRGVWDSSSHVRRFDPDEDLAARPADSWEWRWAMDPSV